MTETGFAESRDGTIVGYETAGAGPPLVLVHGAAADRRCWAPVLPRLAERFTVHALDRRGRGLSAREGGPYAIEREGEDIAAVAEAAGGDVFLVGHSYGALCSLHAAAATDAIARLVLYEPPITTPWHEAASPEALARLREIADEGDHDRLLAAVFRDLMGLSRRQVDALRGARRFWAACLGNAPPLVRESGSVPRIEGCSRFAGIGVPVRLLVGETSPPYQRATADALARIVPGAEVVELPGQGHMAMADDPGLFAKALATFAE
ncbi:alpha/beta fold hydrolase [Actinomadura physcomitrii]|uniref:alpha/beta fold hydrolase n=1 Tax=Actinomadura physcomitrii TaxID=2650748 RepID=UPI001920968D|nr:alpha/beta hydrolase [Actinomadura physcomitrii]